MKRTLATVTARTFEYSVWSIDHATRGLSESLREAGISTQRELALVTDANVDALYGAGIRRDLADHGVELRVDSVVAPGEASKTPSSVNRLQREWARAALRRNALVVAVGGGVVSDLAGFAAATYARGIDWIAVPTTLLAQVDASIGGKTGVDLPEGKNLVGAFWPPRAVLLDVTTLATLPDAELKCGLGEVLKYAVLAGAEEFERLIRLEVSDFSRATPPARAVIEAAVIAKSRLCSRDELDTGDRRLLNLGHTIGHALEAASGYRDLPHGEAVALGLMAEARLAHAIGVAPLELGKRIEAGCSALGLRTRIGGDAEYRERALAALALDKKRGAAQLVFALPVALGDVRIFGLDRDQHRAVIASALASVCDG